MVVFLTPLFSINERKHQGERTKRKEEARERREERDLTDGGISV